MTAARVPAFVLSGEWGSERRHMYAYHFRPFQLLAAYADAPDVAIEASGETKTAPSTWVPCFNPSSAENG